MAAEVDAIARQDRPELIWLLEHPPLLTAGPRAKAQDLLDGTRFPVHETDRGGELTYHGPGQRIIYTMLDLRRRANGDVRLFVRLIERAVIGALDRLGVAGYSDSRRPGVWVRVPGAPGGEAKIAALGFRVRRGISSHGVSLNADPDLAAFQAIVPCGLQGSAVTSLKALGADIAGFEVVDKALKESFASLLGPLVPSPPPGP